MLSDCRPVLSVTLVYCGQTVGRIKMKLGFGLGHIVLDGDLAPTPPKGHSPPLRKFLPCLLWPNGWMDQDAASYAGRHQPRLLCVIWEPSSPSSNGHSPQFSAHVCCGQMAGWIKMQLGREVGIGPGFTVLDGNPAPPPTKGTAPSFRPMSVVA